jgi:alpha-tubulin suppressor-like RCC1 family protein
VDVSAGEVANACGVRSNGSLACWGSNSDGQGNPPSNETFVQVSAGGYHACAVTTQGDVLCWGLDDDGQASPPIQCPDFLDPVGVGVEDITLVTEHWGEDENSSNWDPLLDLYRDGRISVADVLKVSGYWGQQCR